MKTLLLLLIGLLGFSVARAQEPTTHYGIESRNMIFEGKERTFIIITITNNSDHEINHQGYSFSSERFFAKDSKGNKIEDSDSVSGLRLKKRRDEPIIVQPKGTRQVMYSLSQLFKVKTNEEIAVRCTLADNLQVIIKNPIQEAEDGGGKPATRPESK